jgi:hypothetical protein
MHKIWLIEVMNHKVMVGHSEMLFWDFGVLRTRE